MSGKIKSKDLSYSADLPPFLQRLHAQNAGFGDRHERPIARPKKEKDPGDDDGPTMIDESGDTVTKEDLAKLTSKLEAEPPKDQPESDRTTSAVLSEGAGLKQQEAEAGKSQKKRKAVKVIGDDEAPSEPEGKEAHPKVAKKPKKKSRPIKLAFDDEG